MHWLWGCVVSCVHAPLPSPGSPKPGWCNARWPKFALGALSGKVDRYLGVTFVMNVTGLRLLLVERRSPVPDVGILAGRDPVALTAGHDNGQSPTRYSLECAGRSGAAVEETGLPSPLGSSGSARAR